MTDTEMTAAVNNLPSDLNQLTVELKFYINQWGQNTIEIGWRLIAAKELVGHGNWSKWLEDNFKLKERSAQNFMKVAERFGKTQTFAYLNYSTMLTMLALPEGEEEKFIEAKTAEGKPPENMHVRELQAEIKDWKAQLEQKNSEVTDLFAENERLKEDKSKLAQCVKDSTDNVIKMRSEVDKLTAEKNQLEQDNADLQNQLENQTEKIVAPADYEPLKKEHDDLQNQIADLQKKLNDKTIEVQIPADYDSNKQRLKDLQEKLDEYSEFAVIVQTFESIARQAELIIHNPSIGKGLAYYEKINVSAYNKARAILKDFVELLGDEE